MRLAPENHKYLNAASDGPVPPVPHLNGYKIANPAVFARISGAELAALGRGHGGRGYGYEPHFVSGDASSIVHAQLAGTLDRVFHPIATTQRDARQQTGAPRGRRRAATLRQAVADARLPAPAHTLEHGEDHAATSGWIWPGTG